MILIERNVPIPEPKHSRNRYPFGKMKVGDSFVCNGDHATIRVRGALFSWHSGKMITDKKEKKRRKAMRFITRQLGGNSIGVWRIK